MGGGTEMTNGLIAELPQEQPGSGNLVQPVVDIAGAGDAEVEDY